jgi:hypothetical protein
VRFVGDGSADFTIAELIPTTWGPDGPGADEAGAVARDQWHACIVPRSITHESEEYEWTRQQA